MEETAHQEKIPSPLPFLLNVGDLRQQGKCEYSLETLWLLTLMAVACRAENVLAVGQWIRHNAEWLLENGFRGRRGEARLPSQATIYRFFWQLEEQLKPLERQLQHWVVEVLQVKRQPGELLCLGTDGKTARGSKRSRRGDKAVKLLSSFVHDLGLTLLQTPLEGDEAKQAKRMIAELEGLEGIPWLLTGDAAFAEREVAEAVLERKGMYLFDLKDNLSAVKGDAEWAFGLPGCEQDSFFEHSQVRSGELWSWQVEARPATSAVSKGFPGAKQFVRCIRTVISKATGEIRQEVEYALTSSLAQAKELYRYWRGHWEIENRSHHKRDTIFKEDACRTRKGARAFAAMRNLILGLFHVRDCRQVLEQVRRFNAQPHLLFGFLGVAS
jgi:predicted transposase YbfD/YdcC